MKKIMSVAFMNQYTIGAYYRLDLQNRQKTELMQHLYVFSAAATEVI